MLTVSNTEPRARTACRASSWPTPVRRTADSKVSPGSTLIMMLIGWVNPGWV